MAFGKRQPGMVAGAQALSVDVAVAPERTVTDSAAPTRFPFRSLIALLACGAMLYGLVVSYGPDLVRDHRLSGTWQPAYDLRAVSGKCQRNNFVITFCSAKIKSVARPDQAPTEHRFMMLFSGGGGEALVPVRSTADRAAVSIHYAADTKLLNRTLSFLAAAGILALFAIGAFALFWHGIRSDR